jgi:hypothetical protein
MCNEKPLAGNNLNPLRFPVIYILDLLPHNLKVLFFFLNKSHKIVGSNIVYSKVTRLNEFLKAGKSNLRFLMFKKPKQMKLVSYVIYVSCQTKSPPGAIHCSI